SIRPPAWRTKISMPRLVPPEPTRRGGIDRVNPSAPLLQSHPAIGRQRLPALVIVALLCAPIARAATIGDSWEGVWWGESNSALLAQFGNRAVPLPRAIDFGDSYAQIVRRDVIAGGFPLIAFYQM